MNNYDKTTDDFNYYYKRYKKRFTWKGFKKFGWVKCQVLCEKYDIILTDYKTRDEKIREGLKGLGQAVRKFIKESGKNNKVEIFPKKGKPLRIKSKPYDFGKMNNELMGKKRKIF